MPAPSGADEDDDELALEDNDEEPELEIEDNAEDDLSVPTNLISPPRGWPDCFKTQTMKTFIANELAGRRVRLSEAPDPEHLEMAAGIGLAASDSRGNALKLRDRYGWEMLGGFMLLERADAPAGSADLYVGEPHYWNANSRGLWIDLTPRRYKDIVLVESASTPVPTPTPGEQKRHETLRAEELARSVAREAERKAAKAAEKASRKAEKEAAKAARHAAREAEKAAKQREMDELNAVHDEQLDRADPIRRQKKAEEDAAARAEEQKRILEEREVR